MSIKVQVIYDRLKLFILSDMLGIKTYDLPFKKDSDSGFLILLIALMSFLAVLAIAGSLTLNSMTKRWSSGLENKITIEIKPGTKSGAILSNETIKLEIKNVAAALKDNPAVKNVNILSDNDIKELISPWLGDDFALDDIPMPGLIAVDINENSANALEDIKSSVSKVSKYAVVETHREWLRDLLSFTHTLEWVAAILALAVIATTIIAIAGGIRSRMAIHKKELELLHLVGASDEYIARQFQRHAAIVALEGSLIGSFAGIIFVMLIATLPIHSESGLIPQISLGTSQVIYIMILPLLACVIAAITARFTVLRTLSQIP